MPSFWPSTIARCRAIQATPRRRIFMRASGRRFIASGWPRCRPARRSRSTCTRRSAGSSAGAAAAIPRSSDTMSRSPGISSCCAASSTWWPARWAAGRGPCTSTSVAAPRPCSRPRSAQAWRAAARMLRDRGGRRDRRRNRSAPPVRYDRRCPGRDRGQPRESRRAGRESRGSARGQPLAAFSRGGTCGGLAEERGHPWDQRRSDLRASAPDRRPGPAFGRSRPHASPYEVRAVRLCPRSPG